MTYLTKILKLIFIFFIFTNANSFENKIILKVNNEIITSFDINREFRYLALINPKILDLKKNQIFEVSKESIIREKIKKIEILEHFESIEVDKNFIKKTIKQNYSKIGIKNLDIFKEKLNQVGLTLEEYEEKISIEALWNQLIYQKFYSKVKIDKNNIRKKVIKEQTQLLYDLSEIVFNASNKEVYQKKLKIIKKEIETNGFEKAAVIHSISDSKSQGGYLGWINETAINENLNRKLKKLKIVDYTEPEVIPGGFLILQLNSLKKEKASSNTEKEINKLIIIETNRQLNRFSNIYLNKIEKDIKIEKI